MISTYDAHHRDTEGWLASAQAKPSGRKCSFADALFPVSEVAMHRHAADARGMGDVRKGD